MEMISSEKKVLPRFTEGGSYFEGDLKISFMASNLIPPLSDPTEIKYTQNRGKSQAVI